MSFKVGIDNVKLNLIRRKEAEQQRLLAYAHSETGSDRHFAEAMRLDAMGDAEGAAAARAAGVARYEEIRAEYPWPAE